MKLSTFLLEACSIFGLIYDVHTHGVVTDPIPRQLGPVALSACGTGVYDVLKSGKFYSDTFVITSDLTFQPDKYGPIENAVKKIDSGYNATACHLYFCRGYQFADNTATTRIYTPGTVVPFSIDIEAHHTGSANVSVVDLSSQTTIGTPLFNWPVYANDSLGPSDQPLNETTFRVTIPDLGNACSTPGKCVIQWFWWAYSNGQTYESCVDFSTV